MIHETFLLRNCYKKISSKSACNFMMNITSLENFVEKCEVPFSGEKDESTIISR
jgi:hypothetical protein